MTHRPNKLALLISLIGLGMSAGAQASSSPRVPQATALDVVRWIPDRLWQAEDGDEAWALIALHGASLRDDAPAPGPMTALEDDAAVDAAQAAADWEAVAAPPALAAADLEAGGVDIELPLAAAAHRASPETAPPLRWTAPHDIDPDARTSIDPLPQARPSTRATLDMRMPSEPQSGGGAHAPPVSRPIAQAPAPAAMDVGCRVPPPGSGSDTHEAWRQQCVDENLPQDLKVGPSEEVTARIAERFPAAVAARAQAREYALPRRPPRLLCYPAREIIVASPTERVLRGLATLLADDSDAPVRTWSSRPDELVVATHADKVLATLRELSDARHAAAVDDKRRAQRARVHAAAALAAAAAAHVPPPGEPLATGAAPRLDEVDIDLGALVMALPTPPRPPPVLGQGRAVADASLDRLRGGFNGGGLNVSFGIERVVYVNGELVRSTTLQVSDLGRISGGSSVVPSIDAATLALLQSGSGNTVASGSFTPTSLGTVVQNTLDGQNIRTLTVINATVNSLGLLRGLNLQSSLRSAVIDSLRR
jgi:hypothetical protein